MVQPIENQNIEKEICKMTRSGKIQKAIEYCQSVLMKDPGNVNLYIKLGDLYMDWHLDVYQAKHYIDEAITQYQIASERLVDNGEIYYKIGFAFFHKGQLDKAANYFNLAIKNGGNQAQCYYMLANCLKKQDRYTDALLETEEALKHATFNTSRIHYLRHRLFEVVHFSSKHTKFQSSWELFLSILTLPFDKYAQKAFRTRLKVVGIFSELFEGFVFFKAQEYENAIAAYTQAVDKMPGFTILYCLLGDVYRAVGRHEEAIIEYKMAKWLDALCLSAYSGLTQAYEEMGDYDSAIETYKKFIAIHPNNALLHSNVANLYFMKGDVEKAISHYQAAITLNPRHNWTSIAAQTLGYIQQNVTRNVEASISTYQVAYMLAPNEIDVYLSLGSAFYDAEDYENALVVYRRALELDPKNAKIHCNLGYLYWGMGKLTEAIKEYDLSISLDPSYDIAHNNLGVIYLDDLARINKAKECFEKAVDINPNYALALYNLARTLSIKGEKIEAAKYYQLAMDVNAITQEIEPEEIQDRLNNLFD